MFVKLKARSIFALALSAMTAFPAQLWAEKPATQIVDGATTEGVPVFFQSLTLKDGRVLSIVLAPVKAKDEDALLNRLPENPKAMVAFAKNDTAISRPGTRALQAAIEGGWSQFMVVNNDGAIEQDTRFAPVIRTMMKNAFKKIRDLCSAEVPGLLSAAYVSSLETGYVLYQTKAVAAGIGAFLPLFAVSAYQAMFTDKWEAYLNAGAEKGKLVLATLNHWFGVLKLAPQDRAVSTVEVRMFETLGKLYATLLMNSVGMAFVLACAGTLEGLLQVLLYGYMESHDIWDGVMSRWKNMGYISKNFFNNFVKLRIVFASAGTIAAILHVPYAAEGMIIVTSAGVASMLFAQEIEKAASKAKSLWNKVASGCSGLLKARKLQEVPSET